MPFPGAEQLLGAALGGDGGGPAAPIDTDFRGGPFTNNSGGFGDVIITQAHDDARVSSNPVTGAKTPAAIAANALATTQTIATDWRFWLGMASVGMIAVAGVAIATRGDKKRVKRGKS